MTLVQVTMGQCLGDTVAFIVDGAPQQILQLGQAHLGHTRDKHCGNIVGKVGTHLLDEFLVQHVTLGDGKHTGFLHQIGVKSL